MRICAICLLFCHAKCDCHCEECSDEAFSCRSGTTVRAPSGRDCSVAALLAMSGVLSWGIGVEPGGVGPTRLVVVRHALLNQRFHCLQITAAFGTRQRLRANVLPPASIIAFVQLVSSAELSADCIPQQLHDLDPLGIFDAMRTAHILT